MDSESRDRRRKIRLVISETTMVISIIAMVIVLVFLVTGHQFNSDFELERQGMLQIYSTPSGANVEVDGDAPWYQRTNTSKVLAAGEHEVILTRDGYDSWSKNVTISEGLLYRLHYPRLFLKEREKESVYDGLGTTFATISQDHKYLLLTNSATMWHLVNLDRNEISVSNLNVSSVTESGTIKSAEWSRDSSHILLAISGVNGDEWVLLDINNIANSINLTKAFGANFSNVRIFDNSASNLLAIKDGNLHKINAPGRQISAVLAEKVKSYNFYDSEIIYVGNKGVELIKNNDKTTLFPDANPSYVTISRFYDEKYIIMVKDKTIEVLKFDDDEPVFTKEISFTPINFRVGQGGEYVFASNGSSVATLDMEALSVREWTLDNSNPKWIDDFMVYCVVDGKLVAYDFDGLNRREITTGVSDAFPVVITADKWLYYFSGETLTREVIAQ
jgi:hypothetical protein